MWMVDSGKARGHRMVCRWYGHMHTHMHNGLRAELRLKCALLDKQPGDLGVGQNSYTNTAHGAVRKVRAVRACVALCLLSLSVCLFASYRLRHIGHDRAEQGENVTVSSLLSQVMKSSSSTDFTLSNIVVRVLPHAFVAPHAHALNFQKTRAALQV